MKKTEKPESKTTKLTEDEKKIMADMDLVSKCKKLERDASEERQRFDWEWLVRLLYVRGYHFSRYNRASNTVVFSTRTGVKIPINLVGAHLRGVRNQVTSFQPKWEVLPNVTTESAFTNARYSGKVLDYVYEKEQLKRKVKEVVNDALIFSIGIWQFDIEGKKILINRIDPFDFYVDPNVKSPNLNDPEYGAEFVCLTHSLSKDYIQKNPNYKNVEELEADNNPASANYKKFLLQVTRNYYSSKNDGNETVLLHEMYLRERDENGKIKIRVVAYTDTSDLPLRNELLEDDLYPFEILQGDINPGELYGESWVKHLIPVNRVIDALESHIFEYNHLFAKGRFIIDKNSGVRVITNQNGQIIEKNRGSTVDAITVPPLPSTPFAQLDNMRRYLEDISGVHDVSLGRLPGTIRSGVAIAELRQADSTNQADLVDNLEDFLSRSGKRMLRLVADNWTTSQLISVTGIGRKSEHFMAIGESGRAKKDKFKFGDKELPLAVIGRDNEVRVQIGSWLAYTKEARLEKLKELYRLGAIDQKALLEHAEFADIDGILSRSREERILQSKSGSRSETIAKEFGLEMSDEEVALAENELMIEGTEQHAEPEDDHEVHLAIHKEILEESDFAQNHINEHKKLMKWKTTIMSAAPASEAMGDMGTVPTPPVNPVMGAEGMEPTGPTPPEVFKMLPAIGPAAPPLPVQ